MIGTALVTGSALRVADPGVSAACSAFSTLAKRESFAPSGLAAWHLAESTPQ